MRHRGPSGTAQAKAVLDDWRAATRDGLIESGLLRMRLVRARFEFHPIYPSGQLPDDDGLAMVEKVCRDQMVADGLVPDDNPSHCESFVHPPRLNREAPWPLLVADVIPLDLLDGHDGGCDCRAVYEAQRDGVKMDR